MNINYSYKEINLLQSCNNTLNLFNNCRTLLKKDEQLNITIRKKGPFSFGILFFRFFVLRKIETKQQQQ